MLCFTKYAVLRKIGQIYTSHFVKITMLAICKIYTPQKSRSFIISELKLRYPLVHCCRTSTVFLTRIDLLHFLSLACVPMAKELYLYHEHFRVKTVAKYNTFDIRMFVLEPWQLFRVKTVAKHHASNIEMFVLEPWQSFRVKTVAKYHASNMVLPRF